MISIKLIILFLSLIIYSQASIVLPLKTPFKWTLPGCTAQCATGSITPRPGTSPTSNGCGSYDVNVNFANVDNLSGFNTCCNAHDICYNTCSTTKSVCDETFYACLKPVEYNRNVALYSSILANPYVSSIVKQEILKIIGKILIHICSLNKILIFQFILASNQIATLMYETVKVVGCPAYVVGLNATCYCA